MVSMTGGDKSYARGVQELCQMTEGMSPLVEPAGNRVQPLQLTLAPIGK